MIKNLAKSHKKRSIVKDISLEINKSEIVGLLGPNGAGKTTSFYMIIGLIEPDQGAIYLDEQEVTHLSIYERARLGIGYLPQEPSIFKGLTVAENIMAILEFIEPYLPRREEILAKLLAEFSLTHLKNTIGTALSGGEKRRTEIARCLAANPKYILLDEPLAGIDPIAVEEVRNIILDLKNRGIGILITDHNVQDTFSIIDRAYIVYEGRILSEGSTSAIQSDPKVQQLYLGTSFHTIYNKSRKQLAPSKGP